MMWRNYLWGFLLMMLLLAPDVYAIENIDKFCAEGFEKTQVCPPSVCTLKCLGGLKYDGCKTHCAPRFCLEINAGDCPLDSCQLILGCENKEICFTKMEYQPPVCGDLAYFGDVVECCEGFIKRCGIEYFDGSCDMVGKQSIYGVPICIPCGNDICNQFENRCNCPEDCI